MRANEATLAISLISLIVIGAWTVIQTIFKWEWNVNLEVALVLSGAAIILALIGFAAWWLNQTNAFEPKATKNRLKARAEVVNYESQQKLIEIESKSK